MNAKPPNAVLLLPESPYPPRCGNALRDAQQADVLRRAGFCVTVVSLARRRSVEPLPDEEAPDDVDVVFGDGDLAPSETTLHRMCRKAGYVLGSSRNAFAWWTEHARPDLLFEDALTKTRPAVVVMRSLFVHLLPSIRRAFDGRVIVDCHDADVHLAAEMIKTVHGVRRIGPWANLQAVRRACRRFLPMADEVWAVSVEDAVRIRVDCPTANVRVVPSGLSERTGAVPCAGRDNVVLLVANYGYGPNANGAQWLLEEVWPTVRAMRPNACLHLVGARMPDRLARFASRLDSVHVYGEIESLDDLYAEAGVVVVPIREGGGTRVKIIDAWRRGKAVVTTTKGIEGLPAGSNAAALADEPTAFAALISGLLQDPARRMALAAAGLELFRSHLSWRALNSMSAELRKAGAELGDASC